MNDTRRVVANVCLSVGLVAALFVVVLCTLLTATHLHLKQADPLNNAALATLRDRYEAGERDDQMKSDIRQLDLLARKAFFTSQSQIKTGGVLAVIAGAVMLLAFGGYKGATRTVPPPSGDSCEGMFWINIQRARVWIAGGVVLLVAVSLVMVISTPTVLSPDLIKEVPVLPPVDSAPGPAVVSDDSAGPVFPAGFAENSPIFRGSAGSGQTSFDGVPTEWDEESGKNLLWKKPLDLQSWASPVVWGDKVIALGADKDKRMVYCLSAASGEDVWSVEVPEHADATKSYTTDTMDDRWDGLMYAGATPAVNGKQVFTLFSNGQLLALDLNSGEILWSIVPAQTSTNTFGVDNSPLIYKNSVIVAFEGNEKFIARYDAATGRQIWRTERETSTWASPILAKRADGSYLVVLFADPDVTAWDPETGEQVWFQDVLTESPEFCVGPSAVQVGDRVFVNCQNCGIYGVNLSDGSPAWSLEELPDKSGFPDGSSMTTDGKYLYQFYESVLTCVDAASGKVVKQKELPEMANYASALLNKDNLYLSANGVISVLKADPETDFEEVGKGVFAEISDATPAIVKGRVYVRTDESLYCFGEK